MRKINDQEVLNYIKTYARERNGLTPSRAEIAQAFGMGSKTTAQNVLKRLAKKGYITFAERGRFYLKDV